MRVTTASFVFLAILIGACSRSEPPAAPKPSPMVAAPAPSVSLPTVQTAAPPAAPSAFAGDALTHMLTCGDPVFLAQASAQQSQALQTEPRLHCQPPTKDNTVSCTPAEPVSAFGLRIVGFTLNHENGGHGLSAQLQGDMPTLLQGIAEAYPNPARSALYGKLVSLSSDDSVAVRARESSESGQANFECRVAAPGELLFVTMNEPMTGSTGMLSSTPAPPPAPASTPTSTRAPAPVSKATRSTLAPGTSAIAGHIEFPGESIPALHICAISDDSGGAACVHTQRDQNRYRIENLPPGNYQIWAWLAVPEGDLRVMRAVHAVQCVAAPCNPQPRNVDLPADTKVDGMTVNEAAASYPDQPPEPAG